MYRLSGPMLAETDSRNAVTSWRVLWKASFHRPMSNVARSKAGIASAGIVPSSAQARHTANSTSSHFWNLVSSDQMAFISGRA